MKSKKWYRKQILWSWLELEHCYILNKWYDLVADHEDLVHRLHTIVDRIDIDTFSESVESSSLLLYLFYHHDKSPITISMLLV